jgi:septal ring factor EnvC (AmiA/AmiB activator)
MNLMRWGAVFRPGVIASWLALFVAVGWASSPTDDQLSSVRSRIGLLERRLDQLSREAESVERERRELDAQLELADARVRETELLLVQSSDEAERLRLESAELAEQLDQRRELLDRNLRIMALLGRPGPLQLFFDAYRGGELEEAVGTVSVLAAGQMRLVEEYHDVSRQHGLRLAELSRTLATVRTEVQQLEARKAELEGVRDEVARRQASLENNRRTTGATLDDLRAREAALQRLVNVLSSKDRFTGREDIRGYRGALPWPVEGPVVQGFGRQRLAKYNTYTVCNGLRFNAPGSSPVVAVFPGVVAYARHFKGYGNMVVLDHGNDVYSLVAGLGTIHVRVDQRVTMGMRLGLASPPTDGGNVYLEFRVREKPEDPRRWLQLKGDSTSS